MYLPLLIFVISVHTVISQTTECDVDCTNTTDVEDYAEIGSNTIDTSNHISEKTNTTVKPSVLIKATNDTMFLAKPLDPEKEVLDQLGDIHLDTYKESEGTLVEEDTTEMYTPKEINPLQSILQQIPMDVRSEFVKQIPAEHSEQSPSENAYTPTPINTERSPLQQMLGIENVSPAKQPTTDIKQPPHNPSHSPPVIVESNPVKAAMIVAQPEDDRHYEPVPISPIKPPALIGAQPQDIKREEPKRVYYQPQKSKIPQDTKDSCDIEYANLLNTMDDSKSQCEIKQFAFNDGTVGPQETSDIGILEKNMLFSINNPDHMQEMKQLMEIFLKCDKLSDLKNAALYYKRHVNSMLYTFAFSSAILYRKDTQSFSLPGLYNVMPDHFFNAATISEGKNVIDKSQIKLNLPTRIRPEKRFKVKNGTKDRTSQVFDKNKNSKLIFDSSKPTIVKAKRKRFKSKPRNSRNNNHSAKKPVNVQRNALPKEKAQPISEIDPYLTGTGRNPEHAVSYFREDIAANSHHWHWHLVYANHLPNNIIPNRKGELFYYMHNQMLRRYDAERLASGLAFVKPLVLAHNATIQEGYYPHLASANTKTHFSGRSEHVMMQDINNPTFNLRVNIKSMLYWKNNLKQAIKDGYLKHENGSRILINNVDGIDFLGAAIEASIASPNTQLYGGLGLHNAGHILISNMHDPHGKFNAPQGVMCATETALRDPAFWRWHKMVDELFEAHKAHLPPYTDNELLFPNVRITEMSVTTKREIVPGVEKQRSYEKNELGTFFKSTAMDMSRALDFKAQINTAKIRVYHLDHHQFIIKLVAEVKGVEELEGQVRIFMAPRNDQNGKRFKDHELYKHAIEMDRFPVNLKPGKNIIQRDSRESAVTMAPTRQWIILSEVNPKFHDQNNLASFCGCGWPDHLLLPKGSKTGMNYVMFVMISDRSVEKVQDDDSDNSENSEDIEILRTCDDSLTMCGLLRKKFPDLRAMGFPLDRPIPRHSKHWFKRSNMKLHDVKIYLENEMKNVYYAPKRR